MRVLPSQTRGLLPALGISREQAQRDLLVVGPEGRLAAGAAAVNAVLDTLGGPWSAAAAPYRLPAVRRVEDRVYRWVANHRSRFGFLSATTECESDPGACEDPDSR